MFILKYSYAVFTARVQIDWLLCFFSDSKKCTESAFTRWYDELSGESWLWLHSLHWRHLPRVNCSKRTSKWDRDKSHHGHLQRPVTDVHESCCIVSAKPFGGNCLVSFEIKSLLSFIHAILLWIHICHHVSSTINTIILISGILYFEIRLMLFISLCS